MKVLMVSDAGSIHTKRWVSSLVERGVDVVLFSITGIPDDFYRGVGCRVYGMDMFDYKRKSLSALRGLLRHADAVRYLKNLISDEKPDILHAHYATSYALVAALTGFHPFIVSVWGSDVYEFPYQSGVNSLMVKYILSRADKVLSTSHVMAVQTKNFYDGDIEVTPFGVDTDLFCRTDHHIGPHSGGASSGSSCPPLSSASPCPAISSSNTGKRPFVFGTVKTLSHKYGIDLLLRAFARLQELLPKGADTVLEITGKGRDCAKLEELADELGISDKVVFRGFVSHDRLPEVFSVMDVAVFLSREESFGVAAVEAMSCSCPVIVSDAEGFTEVVEDGVSGLIVPREDSEAAAKAMLKLFGDNSLRSDMAREARKRVEKYYRWDDNVRSMIEIYEQSTTR